MEMKEILKKYKSRCKKSNFSLSYMNYNSVKFKYIKKYNVVLAFLYCSYKSIGKYNDVLLFDANKRVYTLVKNRLKELEFDEYKFVFYYRNPFNHLAFNKLFKTNVLFANNKIFGFNDIEFFYKTKFKNDECPDYKLSKISIKDLFSLKLIGRQYSGGPIDMFFMSKIEKINDVAVMRIFVIYNLKITEVYRIYIEKESVLKFHKNTANMWQKITDNNCFCNLDFKIKNIENFKGTRIYYYKDIFPIKYYSDELALFITFLEYPVVEQLYKTGLSDLICASLDEILKNGVEDFIIDTFGYFNDNKNNLYGKLGVNKYQFNKMKESKAYIDAICVLRFVFEKKLSSIENQHFDKACMAVLELIYSNINNKYCMHSRTYIIKNLIVSIVKRMKKLKKESSYIIKILEMLVPEYEYYDTERYVELLEYYSSYINTVIDIQKLTGELYDLEFEDEYDLIDMLENAEIILETLKNSKKTQKFKKRAEELEKFSYENSEFAILCPQTPKELVKEGRQLRHCVGEFTNKIIKGKTNIFFLRKQEDINKPFFTIEVSSRKKVKQVHGFDNCDINRNSSEYKFLREWAKKNKLKIGRIDELYDAN